MDCFLLPDRVMQKPSYITQLIGGAALAALAFFTPALGAQESSRLFTWRGSVDDDVRIAMRAGSIQSQIVSGDRSTTTGRVTRTNVLPRRDGVVRVELIEGRGLVRVIQQPTAENGYTTIVQVKDGQRGAAPYRFATFFDPAVRVGRGRGRGQNQRLEPVQGQSVGGEVDLAVGTPVLRWRGNVDGDLRIVLRRNQVGYELRSGANPSAVSASVISGGLPLRDARLSLSPRQARGTVAIVQRPSAANGYTAIIQITDSPAGYGYYDFDVVWR
jgi:hypothetical protein